LKAQLEALFVKTLENMGSVKFYILASATVFFALGKLDAVTWQQTVLAIAGLRAVNEVSAMVTAKKAATVVTEAKKA
jgi:hypothetical protein